MVKHRMKADLPIQNRLLLFASQRCPVHLDEHEEQ